MRKSKEPESISAWTQTDTLDLNDSLRYADYSDTYTYTHPMYLADEQKLYLFWRGSDFKPNMAISDDMGASWTDGRILILSERKYYNRRPYLKVASNGKDEIHFAFTQGHPRREKENSVYYMSYSNGTYFRADGSEIKAATPDASVQPQEADLVYDARGKAKAWVRDVVHYKDNRPVAIRDAKAGNPLQFLWMSNQKYIHYTNYQSSIKIPISNQDGHYQYYRLK